VSKLSAINGRARFRSCIFLSVRAPGSVS